MEETMGLENAMEFNVTAPHNRYATASHPTPTPSLSAFTSTANQHHHPLQQPPLPQPTPLPPHQQHRNHFHNSAASTCTLYTGHSSAGSNSSSATSSCSNSNGSRSGSSKGISGGCTHAQSAVDVSPHTATLPSSADPAQTVVSGVKEELQQAGGCGEDTMPEADVDYVNAHCVIFTFFTGDLDKIVDEHFSRSLSQRGSFNANENLNKNGSDGANDCKAPANQNDLNTRGEDRMDNWPPKNGECQPTPMCQRNFPPSFWNENFYSNAACNNINNNHININGMHLNCMYTPNGAMGAQPHPQDPSAYLSAAAAAVAAAADYSALNMHHHHAAHAAQTEAWYYASGFQPTHHQMAPPYVRAHHPTNNYHHHHLHSPGLNNFRYGGVSAAAAAAAGSAFSPRYSSLLIQPSVTPSRLPTIPGQGEFPLKSMSMSEWPTFAPHSHQSSGTDGPPTYEMDTGAASLDSHEANKDLFWF